MPNTVFFLSFVAQEGRKVGSLKRRAWSHLVVEEIKNCTPLWREARLEVVSLKSKGQKQSKTPHVQSTIGS